jgi:UDP-glucose 4-epimerase
MRIILTGVTSFSGVIGVTRGTDTTSPLVEKRIKWLRHRHPTFQLVPMDQLSASKTGTVDLVGFHGTATFDYRDPNFDVMAAVQNTLETSKRIFELFPNASIVHTGTYGEPNESIGESPLETFNGYSASKALIYSHHKQMLRPDKAILKYVMPNPFGPLEPPKLTEYLLRTWAKGEVPLVKFPNYIRDNVPIDLLASHYALSVKAFSAGDQSFSVHPSKYAETNSTFVTRYANEISERFSREFNTEFPIRHDYPEPRIRVNRDYCQDLVTDWDEVRSWDQIAADAEKRMMESLKE